MNPQPMLFTPGPVDLFPETLEALGAPVPYMITDEWLTLYAQTVAMAKSVFQTDCDLFIMTAPGSGAIETGLASLFQKDDRVLVVRNGLFAERLVQVLTTYGCHVLAVEGVWGEAIDVDAVGSVLRKHPDTAGIAVVANETGTGVCNPVEALANLAHDHEIPIFVDAVSGMGGYDLPVDRWKLDVVASSSNKAFEMAPGLGLISVRPEGWAVIESKEKSAHRGWYYNLSTWRAARDREFFPFPSTPATSLIAGLHASLQRICHEEGIEGHWRRYRSAQTTLRDRLRSFGFEMLVDDDVASPTVTTVGLHPSIDDMEELRSFLRSDKNILVAGGGGPLAGKILRIGHMGLASTEAYLAELLRAIQSFLPH